MAGGQLGGGQALVFNPPVNCPGRSGARTRIAGPLRHRPDSAGLYGVAASEGGSMVGRVPRGYRSADCLIGAVIALKAAPADL